MKKFLLIFSALVAMQGLLSAQTDETRGDADESGIWLSGSVEKKFFDKKLTTDFEMDLRTGFSEGRPIERVMATLEADWKFCDYFKAGVGYAFMDHNRTKKGWQLRHRYYLNLTGSYKINKQWSIQLRERIQGTYRMNDNRNSQKAANPEYYLRSRLKVSYDIPKSPFEPYATGEFYYSLNNPIQNQVDKIRYTVGSEYKINKKQVVELYYRHIQEFDDDMNVIYKHVIGVGYLFKL